MSQWGSPAHFAFAAIEQMTIGSNSGGNRRAVR